VLALVEMSPVEDLMLVLLRAAMPDMQVKSLISADQDFPLVLVRSSGAWGEWDGDPRFLDAAIVTIHTLCSGPNADEDAALLAEATRVVIRDSANVVVPQRGHITKADMIDRPRRVTDWATATGPVQYADLPTGVSRYETQFRVEIRKPRIKPFPPESP
jgi:hypothetical protein